MLGTVKSYRLPVPPFVSSAILDEIRTLCQRISTLLATSVTLIPYMPIVNYLTLLMILRSGLK